MLKVKGRDAYRAWGNEMAKAADVVVQCLENEGVEYVFGIPGEENLDLLESLRK